MKTTLIFIPMGMSTTENKVGNHRIRTCFLTPKNESFFVELLSYANGDKFYVDFSIDCAQALYRANLLSQLYKERDSYPYRSAAYDRVAEKIKEADKQDYYNAKEIQNQSFSREFSPENVVRFINQRFDCHFTSMELDPTSRLESIEGEAYKPICISPKS